MNKEYLFITGATGFLGSHVIDKLLTENIYEIITVVKKAHNYKNVDILKRRGTVLIEGDFYDENLIEHVFKKFPIKFVIHLAAIRGPNSHHEEDYYRVNVKGTEILLNASLKHNVKKFIFCSSVGVFGTVPKEVPATLQTELNGDNLYHNSKILAEKRVKEFISKGLNAYILRPTIIYGPEEKGFPVTLVKMIRSRVLLLPRNDIKIHLLDVMSLVDLISKIIRLDILNKRTFIVADEAPISLKELVNLIHFHFFCKDYPFFLKAPNSFFTILLRFFQIIKNESWKTKILLISKSWHYDISDTVKSLNYVPVKTKNSFICRMSI